MVTKDFPLISINLKFLLRRNFSNTFLQEPRQQNSKSESSKQDQMPEPSTYHRYNQNASPCYLIVAIVGAPFYFAGKGIKRMFRPKDNGEKDQQQQHQPKDAIIR